MPLDVTADDVVGVCVTGSGVTGVQCLDNPVANRGELGLIGDRRAWWLIGGKLCARDHFRGHAAALPRLEPTDGEVVSAVAFLHQGFDVVALTSAQRDRLRTLRGELVPLTRIRPLRSVRNADFVGLVLGGAQVEFGGVVTRDPKRVAAAARWNDEA